MKSVVSALFLIAASLGLGGCAFSVYPTPLNYSYAGAIKSADPAVPAVRVAEIRDTRDVADKRMILNQINGNGQTTTGGWQAEKELALVVQDALQAGAQRLQATTGDETPYLVLDGELTNISNRSVMGWSSGSFTMQIQVRLTLRNERTKQILYRDSITSEGSASKGANDVIIRTAFNTALTNLVDRTFTDEYFLQQVRSAAAAPQ